MINVSCFHAWALPRSLASGTLCAQVCTCKAVELSQTSGLICIHALSSHYGMCQEVEKEIEEEASGKKPRKRTHDKQCVLSYVCILLQVASCQDWCL